MLDPQTDPLSLRPALHMAARTRREEPYAKAGRHSLLSIEALRHARKEIAAWPGYAETPLKSLNGLARRGGVAGVFYKDEATRFGLGSFKALGGAYAVMRATQSFVLQRTGERAEAAAIAAGTFATLCRDLTVTCATDGNHGRSVAWGARTFGCRCVIYVHETVSQGRSDAIAAYGAEVRRVAGNYDDAVRQAAADADRNGWQVVSDTSYPGYTEIPRDVMQGYGVMVDEALTQFPAGVLPTHIFVQGGVGGLAAAVCATCWELLGAKRPLFVVVEPDRAACLFQSAVRGEPTVVHGALDTLMAGLACGEVSTIAWDILKDGADAFVTIEDEAAVATMRLLATPESPDQPIVAGESAVAGLTGFLQAAAHRDLRAALAIDGESVIFLFGTEGATDPDLYERLVGRPAEEVAADVGTKEASLA